MARHDGWRDVADGAVGAAVMTAALLTPFSRGRRARWGAGGQAAARRYPGDELVRRPRWGWTHAHCESRWSRKPRQKKILES